MFILVEGFINSGNNNYYSLCFYNYAIVWKIFMWKLFCLVVKVICSSEPLISKTKVQCLNDIQQHKHFKVQLKNKLQASLNSKLLASKLQISFHPIFFEESSQARTFKRRLFLSDLFSWTLALHHGESIETNLIQMQMRILNSKDKMRMLDTKPH